LLAALSAAVLVGQRQLLPERGVSVATGVVAALCKSISPGGIILGPMIGIFTEGLLVEVVLLPAPRAALAAAMAGTLCALWAACQVLLTQYLFYGRGVLDLYLALLQRTAKWLGISPSAGWRALAGFAVVVSLIGATGGLLGRRVGIDSRCRLVAETPREKSRLGEEQGR
jgi:hypothetical protein